MLGVVLVLGHPRSQDVSADGAVEGIREIVSGNCLRDIERLYQGIRHIVSGNKGNLLVSVWIMTYIKPEKLKTFTYKWAQIKK